jgi:hypothetical protein
MDKNKPKEKTKYLYIQVRTWKLRKEMVVIGSCPEEGIGLECNI